MALFGSGVEYAIHSLLHMTDSEGVLRNMSVRALSELQGVPYDYLGKIFTKLSRAGLVRSNEGKGGGFRLAKEPKDINVLDIVHAIEGNKKIFACREVRRNMAIFKDSAPLWCTSGICNIHQVMLLAQEKMEETLAQHTILDLTRKMHQKAPAQFATEVQEWIDNK